MSPADDWQLAQGTVEFRDEERRHRNRVDVGRTDPVTSPVAAAVRPALCPNCAVEVDESNFCGLCGKVVRA